MLIRDINGNYSHQLAVTGIRVIINCFSCRHHHVGTECIQIWLSPYNTARPLMKGAVKLKVLTDLLLQAGRRVRLYLGPDAVSAEEKTIRQVDK